MRGAGLVALQRLFDPWPAGRRRRPGIRPARSARRALRPACLSASRSGRPRIVCVISIGQLSHCSDGHPTQALSLLGGLSPRAIHGRHWQKKPLLVRGAVPGFAPLLGARRAVRAGRARRGRVAPGRAAGRATGACAAARSRAAPCRRCRSRAGRCWCRAWTCTTRRAHELLPQFRFVPDARLDDLMISYASDGGGVGPHFDSYDVFLLQAQGRRRWRIGRQKDLTLRDDVPLKMLRHFEPEAGVGARARRHALPAAALGARRHRARASA